MRLARFDALRQLVRINWGDYPVTPGRLVYLLKLKFGDGWRVAYYRDVIRPRILATTPISTPDQTVEIHVLTSQGDWLNLLWALQSFYAYSECRYALCIHDDGTLGDEACRDLSHAFPDARLISREASDRRLQPILANYPLSQQLRATNTLALKVFDFSAFLESDRMMICDSDILFFSKPRALLTALETSGRNTLNQDWRSGYTLEQDVIARLDFVLPPLINSGLGLIQRGAMRIEWIEEFLGLPGILGHSHQIEQTLIALCCARFGFDLLPREYDVHPGPMRDGVPCRHYAGPMRPLLYGEGMRILFDRGFLNA